MVGKTHSINTVRLPDASPVDPITALFYIHVIEAKDVPKLDLVGKSDPYVSIRFAENIKFKTRVIKRDLNPVWNETFKLLVLKSQQRYPLSIVLKDWDLESKNDLAGSAQLDLSAFFTGTDPNIQRVGETFVLDTWINMNHEGKKEAWGGKLHLKIECKGRKQVEREFWTQFAHHFDTDNGGTISEMELIAMAESIGSEATTEELQQLFKRADVNGDGELSFEEFANVMTSDGVADTAHNPIVAKILPDHTVNFIWWAVANGTPDSTVGSIMLERGLYGKVDRKGKQGEVYEITVYNRETGQLEPELIPEYIRVSLRLMYTYGISGSLASKMSKILRHMSQQQGKKFTNPNSKKEILPFIAHYNLTTDDILEPLDNFANFNEFFYRKLKPGVRPIAEPQNSALAVCPADCRLHVFPTIDEATEIWIKGKNFTVDRLLQNQQLAQEFYGGSLVIARLAPQDYHRFHSPVTGIFAQATHFPGHYYTVNPIAIRTPLDVYTENTRTVVTLQTQDFGNVAFVAIGATMVGSIEFTVKEGQPINKGDEVGYFAFGGSTVILLFRKGTIVFEQDLLANSRRPLETLVKMGTPLGRRPNA